MNNFCDLGDSELIFFFFLMTLELKRKKNVGFTFSVYALHTMEKRNQVILVCWIKN